MALKFAFSTVACPQWTIDQVAEKAAEYGYTGVELRTGGGGGCDLASDPSLTSPANVKKALDAHKIEAVCLSTDVQLHHRDTTLLRRAQNQTIQYLEQAAEMNCAAIRVFGLTLLKNHSIRDTVQHVAEVAKPLAEKAAELGVQLLFENQFSLPKEWWWCLGLIDNPMVGIAWDLRNSAVADVNDRGGWVSVTTLNSRIRLAKVVDVVLPDGGYCQLGDGDLDIYTFLKRLRGVGFEGYVSVEWPRGWFMNDKGESPLDPPEEYLPGAIEKLKAWSAEIDQWVEKGRASTEKSLAKFAPKSRAQIKEEVQAARDKAAKAAAKAKEKAAAAG